MSVEHEEKLIDELIRKVKTDGDISAWKKEAAVSPLLSVIASLNAMPRKRIERPDFGRVKTQIMQRIAAEPTTEKQPFWAAVLHSVPAVLKIGSGVVASVIVVISLAIGTAAASLESLPGQPLYSLKTVVEKVQMKLATDDAQRANLQIKFANNRLDELEKVLEKNKQGEISGQEVQQIVTKTVKDLESTNTAITQTKTSSDKPVAILTKLVDLNNKQTALLQTATVQSEGEVKIELQKALEASQLTKDKAIENIERAGLKVEENPVTIEDQAPAEQVTATGKLTAITDGSVSIGTAKFFVTNETKFVNMDPAGLKIGLTVDISGKTEGTKTYATQITLKAEPSTSPSETPATAPENQETGN
ncbi:MAG: DUF5667 domain-containing protein [Candidatus Saccharibacteria bacterium]